MAKKPPTPEGIASQAVRDYLTVIRIGKVKRINVGQVRMGPAPTHPWQRDTRRVVRFGEVGHSDLQVELNLDDPRIPSQFRGRDLFPEVKKAGWNPPPVPKALCSKSTLDKYQHHLDQVAFLTRQIQRGNLGGFVRSPLELYHLLLKAGFRGLPVPETPPTGPARPTTSRTPRRTAAKTENGSQK